MLTTKNIDITNLPNYTSNSRNNRRNADTGFYPHRSFRRQQNHRLQTSNRPSFSYYSLQSNLNNHRGIEVPSHFMNGYPGNGPSNSNYSHCKLHKCSNSSNYLPVHQPAATICHDPLSSKGPSNSSSTQSFTVSPQYRRRTSTRQDNDAYECSANSSVGLPSAAFTSAFAPNAQDFPPMNYLDALSVQIWHFFLEKRQTPVTYAKKLHFKNALHMIISSVFENSQMYLVGSSINGFGSDGSDTDMCLVVTSQELQGKRDASAVLQHLMTPLRKCSFIKNCILIQAKVPILKFRDQLSGIDCDLNVNNVVGIYNTHLLAMYTRVDWRLRPLGLFVKHWAQRMDIHDGSRGRLSTYPLLLMLIQFLQCGCSPPVLPSLQARFPKVFNYDRPLKELDMRLQLPWTDMVSSNTSALSELFIGFISYYNNFDFGKWAISVRCGHPIPIDVAIRCLPPQEQAHTSASFKIFVEEPFCQTNAARSLYDETVLAQIQRVFARTERVLRAQRAPLHSLWTSLANVGSSSPSPNI